MKKYAYVSVIIGMGPERQRQIIDAYAAKGWRYVGYIPTDVSGHGMITSIDLIFEMDV